MSHPDPLKDYHDDVKGDFMIKDLSEFKIARRIAAESGDILQVKEWAKRFGVKLSGSDAEIMERIKKIPEWD